MRRLLVPVTALVVLAGCAVGADTAEPPSSSDPTPTAALPESARPAPQARPSAPSSPAKAPRVPRRLTGPQIGAQVIPLELDGSGLVPPDDPTVLGWWGRKAGATHGTTLLVGHTVHDGGGTFDDLEHIAVGSTFHVSGLAYVVKSNRTISKAALARQSSSLFDQRGSPRLVLVTCEDYNPTTGHYASNVVLTARPRSTP